MNADRGARPADFLWLLLPLAVLAAFSGGAEPAGLAVGFALYFVGPLLGGLIMLAKGRSVRAGLLVAAWWYAPQARPSSGGSSGFTLPGGFDPFWWLR